MTSTDAISVTGSGTSGGDEGGDDEPFDDGD